MVEQEVGLVVVEVSGGYEAALVSELVARGQAVAGGQLDAGAGLCPSRRHPGQNR